MSANGYSGSKCPHWAPGKGTYSWTSCENNNAWNTALFLGTHSDSSLASYKKLAWSNFPKTDKLDWYYIDVGDKLGSILDPQVKVTVPSSKSVKVTVEYHCDYGTANLLIALKGKCVVDSGKKLVRCSAYTDSSGDAIVHFSPSCKGSLSYDDGRMFISVENSGSYFCSPAYSLNVHL